MRSLCCTTCIAVVIIDATSATFDGRMIVSALVITLPNSRDVLLGDLQLDGFGAAGQRAWLPRRA